MGASIRWGGTNCEREREREIESNKYCRSIANLVNMVREARGLVQSNPSVKGEYGIARDGEREKDQSEQ